MPQAGRSVIDGYEFARAAGEIAGSVALAQLGRLAESGVTQTRAIEYAVRGGLNERGKPALHVHVAGTVVMTCQRCLEAVAVPLLIDSELELAASEEEAAMAEDDIDRIVASPAMDVVAMVEDELILALPMVPRHEDCGPALERMRGQSESPFARLTAFTGKH